MRVKVSLKSTSSMLKDKNLDKGGKVQKAIDSEVLKRSDPYVPFRSGALRKSGTLGTKIGSGEVIWNAPYAQKQYYKNAGKGRQGTAKYSAHNYKCLRGKLWFERMKADHLQDIIETAKKSVGGN